MANLLNAEIAVLEKCINLGCDGLSEGSQVKEGVVEEVGKTAAFAVTGQEKGVENRSDFSREKDFDQVGMNGDEVGNLDDFGYLIQEEMGKVTLDTVSSCLVPNTGDESRGEGIDVGGGGVGLNGNGAKCDVDGGSVIEIAVGSSEHPPSESEEETSEEDSASSSGTSSSSDDDDDDDDDEKEKDRNDEKGKCGTLLQRGGDSKEGKVDGEVEMEEGEIIASDIDEMVVWSGDEDEDVTDEPLRSKNELTVLPPVPPVNVTLEPHHETVPVGVVLSIFGAQVIVEGVEKHNPLDEGTILWITETRSPLGIVDETFGPVKNPCYIIRHNTESEVPSGLKPGESVCFVPEFANHILHDKSLYAKAYDASGANDEELSEEEYFSDDEKEAEYRKMLKMKKRGNNDENVKNKKMERREQKNKFGDSKHDHAHRQNAGQGTQVRGNHHHHVPSPVVPPKMNLGNNSMGVAQSPRFPMHSGGANGMGVAQNLGFTMQSARPNGSPSQQSQSMGFAQSPGFIMQSAGANGSPFQPPQSMGVPQSPGFTMQSAGPNGMGVAQNPGFAMQSTGPNGMGVAQNPGFTMQSAGGNRMGVAQNPGFIMQSAEGNGIPFQTPQSMGVAQSPGWINGICGSQNPGFSMQSAGANGIPFQPPQSMSVAQSPGFTMQSAGPNGIPFQPPQSISVAQSPGFMQSAGTNGIGITQNPVFAMQSVGPNGSPFQPSDMGVAGFPTNNTLPWLGQVNPQMLYQMSMQNGLAAFGQQIGMNPACLPQNPSFPTMPPGFGSGPWPCIGFGQNMIDPSVFAMVAAAAAAQSQQLPFPFNNGGQQSIPFNLQQMAHNSSVNTNLATTSQQPEMSANSNHGPYENLLNPSHMNIGQQQQVGSSSSVKTDLNPEGTSHGMNQGSCQNSFNPTSQFGMSAAPAQQQQHQQQQQQHQHHQQQQQQHHQQQHSPSGDIGQMVFNSSMKPNTVPLGRPDMAPSSNQGRGGGKNPHHRGRGGGRFGSGKGRSRGRQ